MAIIKRTSSTYSFHGECFVEFLSGPSPLEVVDGELQYTVENPPPAKKRKKKKYEILPPELNESPTLYERIQYTFYKIVSNGLFDGFIMTCIILNTMLMSAEHYEMSSKLQSITVVSDFVSFGSIYT